MNNENKIDLSIEMYEDLKETLVKAIKNDKPIDRELVNVLHELSI